MKRKAYSTEPSMSLHRWVLVVIEKTKFRKNTKYFYCLTKKEVKEKILSLESDLEIQVYRATHNFREAWVK